jgi:hypothetical protein
VVGSKSPSRWPRMSQRGRPASMTGGAMRSRSMRSSGSGSETDSTAPFLGNLATAAAFGQVSESATTWQIFRKIEYPAGMPQDILSTARDQAEQSHPQALQWVSPQRALRLASSIGVLAYGGTDRLIFGTLSHEQIGRTRTYVITKWRQSEIQQVKETKVPPPRTHGEVGDPVGGQCIAVR